MENENVKSIIIIASGGLDSTTLIWKAMSEKIQIKEILSFNYGQKHSREIENIKSILLYLRNNGHDIDHKIVDENYKDLLFEYKILLLNLQDTKLRGDWAKAHREEAIDLISNL